MRLAILLVFAGALACPAFATVKSLRGRRVAVRAPPTSQLRAVDALHPVGKTLEVGDSALAVARDGERLRIAPAPGKNATRPVREGKAVTVSGTRNGERLTLELGFVRERGEWQYFAAEAVRFELAGHVLELIDADADGRYGDQAHDAWRLSGGRLLLPLEKEIPVGRYLLRLLETAPDGSRLRAELTPVEGTEGQLAGLEALNHLRSAHGLFPVRLDAALSRGCTAHARYLRLNGWTGFTNPHVQTLGLEGASEEGARAAQRSAIGQGPPKRGVLGFWITYYHRIGLMHPLLERVGINADEPSLAVIDASGWADVLVEPRSDPPRYRDFVCVPADGSTGFETRAGAEKPRDPVPDMDRRGNPLMLYFLDPRPEVKGVRGTLALVRGRRAVPVPVLAADPGGYPFLFGIVPAGPLEAGRGYVATWEWTDRGGERQVHRVRFATRKG